MNGLGDDQSDLINFFDRDKPKNICFHEDQTQVYFYIW